MPRSLKLYVLWVVAASAIAFAAATVFLRLDPRIALRLSSETPTSAEVWLGVAFWTALALVASALPVQMPKGVQIAVAIAPIVAAMRLGGPIAAAWVAGIGSFELRELRGEIPWYGTLTNHATIALPAIVGAAVMSVIPVGSVPVDFAATMLGAGIFYAGNTVLAIHLLAIRTDQSTVEILRRDIRASVTNLFALSPLAWLMAQAYVLPGAGWWASLLFALPLYSTRTAYHRFVEMREMFTQTVRSLAGAVDARDKFTGGHSERVQTIAVDIGVVMGLSDAELEALEWGGLLHDIGKIGVPDAVLLKTERLTRDERAKMNMHPVIGAQIIAPVQRLAPELPIIRHHHEWYNGSGYPDRLIGDEIPKLARILHVADAFEAMTAQRPYRMRPLTAEQALGELRKFAGIQFDPRVVDAFVKTKWAQDVPDPGRPNEPRPVPTLSELAAKRAAENAANSGGVDSGAAATAHPATNAQPAPNAHPATASGSTHKPASVEPA